MNPLQKAQEAVEVSQVWQSYFPTFLVEVEHWRLLLDQYAATTITKAIQRCVHKRRSLNGKITVKQMLTFIESTCYKSSSTQEVSQ